MLPLVIDAIEFSRACLVAARNSQLSSAAFSIAIAVSLIYLISTLCVLLNYYVLKRGCRPTKSYLYYGRVAHARVKGGAVHKFSYPLFLAYLVPSHTRHPPINEYAYFTNTQPYNHSLTRSLFVFTNVAIGLGGNGAI